MTIQISATHRNEEAAKKWCPFSRSRNSQLDSNLLQPHRHCLTVNCMAWVDETDYMYDIALGRCGLVSLA